MRGKSDSENSVDFAVVGWLRRKPEPLYDCMSPILRFMEPWSAKRVVWGYLRPGIELDTHDTSGDVDTVLKSAKPVLTHGDIEVCSFSARNNAWSISFNDEGIELGYKQPATLMCRMTVDRLARRFKHSVNLFELSQLVFRVLDGTGECSSALAHIDYWGNTGGSLIYTNRPMLPLSWSDRVGYGDWHGASDRDSRVRGVYWGNYVGKRLGLRLPANTVNEFLELEYEHYGKPQAAGVMPGGGQYFFLTKEPKDVMEASSIAVQWDDPQIANAVWLRQRFRKAGIV